MCDLVLTMSMLVWVHYQPKYATATILFRFLRFRWLLSLNNLTQLVINLAPEFSFTKMSHLTRLQPDLHQRTP